MRRLVFIIGILFLSYWGIGQGCLPEGITFETQEQIDSFKINYPNCTEIEGDVVFFGGNDFSGIKQLKSIKGSLDIAPERVDLQGFNNLESVGGDLYIHMSAYQTSFLGLDNLKTVGGELLITFQEKLKNLYGLEHLGSVGSLRIFNMAELESLNGLNKYLSIQGKVTINGNSKLVDCAALCHLSQTAGDFEFYENGDGCNEVDNCENEVFGFVFYDINENGFRDTSEFGVSSIRLSLDPSHNSIFSNQYGNFSFPILEKGTYTLSVDENDIEVTTNPLNYVFDSTDVSNLSSLDFGIKLTDNVHKIQSSISSTSPRCFEDVQFKLNLTNIGSYTENGKVIIRYDGYNTFTGVADPMPTSIDTTKHLLYYDYQDFQPFEQREYIFWLKMPGVEAIDQFISNSGFIYYVENSDTSLLSHTFLREKIRCSYDPNDKTAYPFGEYDEHYTLKDDTLRYTIRFQNTGNAEAYNIKVRDTLSTNLDWNTFKVLNSSHTVETSITRNGAVVFAFDNIFLPDSTSNPAGSQGYVTYEVLPKEHLPENTLIENTAFIYFDYNPAIVTNTTFNTMVTEIPVGTDDILSKNALAVYPNPTDEVFRIGLESSEELVVELLDLTGRVVKRYDYRKKKTYSMNGLESGLYFVKVSDKLNGRDLGVGKIVKN